MKTLETPILVVADGTPEPPDDFTQVVPSTRPGSRAPHAWIDTASSTPLDRFGRDRALVHARDAAHDAAPLLDATRARGLPADAIAMTGTVRGTA